MRATIFAAVAAVAALVVVATAATAAAIILAVPAVAPTGIVVASPALGRLVALALVIAAAIGARSRRAGSGQ